MPAPDPNSIHAQAEDVNVLRLLFIAVKCILIIIMMFFGIRAHYMRSQKITRVTKIFTFYIGVMGALLVMETLYHDLLLFYMILVASTVGLIWLIEMFVERVQRYVSEFHYRASKWAIRICYGVTISLVVFGLLPKIGARCHGFMVYPLCFFLYLFLHIVLYLLTSFFWCKTYFVQQHLVLAEEETYQLPEHNSDQSSNDAAELPTAKQYSFRKMFSMQINRFQIMHTVHAIVNIVLIVCAYRLNTLKEYDFLQCYSDADHVWKVNRHFGQTFQTLHVLMVIIEALQAERILYSIPSKMGYFKHLQIQREIKHATASTGDGYGAVPPTPVGYPTSRERFLFQK